MHGRDYVPATRRVACLDQSGARPAGSWMSTAGSVDGLQAPDRVVRDAWCLRAPSSPDSMASIGEAASQSVASSISWLPSLVYDLPAAGNPSGFCTFIAHDAEFDMIGACLKKGVTRQVF